MESMGKPGILGKPWTSVARGLASPRFPSILKARSGLAEKEISA